MRIGTRSLPIEYYILRIPGPAASRTGAEHAVVGYLAELPIFGTVTDSAGNRYHFVGLAPRLPDGRYDVESLSSGEWIVAPGLSYRSVDTGFRVRRIGSKWESVASALHSWWF